MERAGPGAVGAPPALGGGRYRLEGPLGAGGGGEVFAARDTLLERPVAVKRLPPGLADPEPTGAAARLLAEARALARLSHPNVVPVYDAFEAGGRLHVVMERVAGPTLRRRLDEHGPLPLAELARLAAHLAAALAHAHGQGIVHRDVKPENVLLAPDPGGAGWLAKLVDFGIAYAAGGARLTLSGMAAGTPAYVAPEQALGQVVDGRADLYALGCLLYEAATGGPPFAGDDPLLVVSQHLHAQPTPPSARRADLPLAWNDLIVRLLAKRPEDRLPSAEALLAELAATDASVTPGTATPTPAWVRPLVHDLPTQLTSFVGREQELAEVRRLLSGVPDSGDERAPAGGAVRPRLVTLTGPGGTGKTRLALQAAAQVLASFRDGVWLVELAALTAPALVPRAVAAAVGVLEQPGRPLSATLAETLRPRRLLLVLDNCEHLVQACASLAETLLQACPDLLILATSREPLGIPGEALRRVPSLASPPPSPTAPAAGSVGPPPEQLLQFEAVRLFADRAATAQPGFAVTTQNAAALAQICHRLDGIPLALELAAARVRILPVEQVLQRLDDRFRLLTGGSRTALPRQQTLRAAVAWSYDLLSESERVLFNRLAVFAGGFTLGAAEAVCSGAGEDDDQGIEAHEILDLLTQLVDKSLVLAEARGAARYRLLETLRQYAQERLLASGEAARLHGRHAAYYAALAAAAEPELRGPRPAVWLDRLEEELDNLRGALRWCEAAPAAGMGLTMGAALQTFWWHRGHMSEGRDQLAALLALPEAAGHTTARAGALNAAGLLAYYQGDHAAARALHEEDLALRRVLGDKFGLAQALSGLAHVALRSGDPGTRALCEQSVALFREVGDKRPLAYALHLLGVAIRRTDAAAAGALFEEGAALCRETGDAFATSTLLNARAGLARSEGDGAAARPLYQEALAIRREIGDKRGIAIVLHNLGYLAHLAGEGGRAAARFRESLALFRDVGDRHGIAWCLAGLAGLALAEGREGQARAARLFGAAAPWLGAEAIPLHPPDRADVDRTVTGVRAALGEAAFAHAWAAGQAMSPEAAVEYALAERAPSD